MSEITSNLASSAGRRKIMASPSSDDTRGLNIGDIVHRLIDQKVVLAGQARATPPTLEEVVFKALAAAKIWTSRVAMHLRLEDRARYFRQLDLLHDCDEWFGDDKPVLLESYKNFIRFMLMINGNSKPSLALDPHGKLVAVWIFESDRLTVEFNIDGTVEWVVSRREAERLERAAGKTSLARLPDNLGPYHPERWFKLG